MHKGRFTALNGLIIFAVVAFFLYFAGNEPSLNESVTAQMFPEKTGWSFLQANMHPRLESIF